jgi:hypothetical protein
VLDESISPITHEYSLPCSPDEAFAAYTGGIGAWWDPRYTANPETLQGVTIEPFLGGRVYATHSDIGEADWGVVTVCARRLDGGQRPGEKEVRRLAGHARPVRGVRRPCVTRHRNVPVPGTGTFLRSQPLIDEVAIQRNCLPGIDVEEPQQLTEREVRRSFVVPG